MNPLRELLPRPQTIAEASDSIRTHDAARISTLRRALRQKKTNSACDPCRKRKTKCDGRLPKCLMCDHRGESCAYTYSIRHLVTVTEGEDASRPASSEMLESLRTLPDEQALDLLQRLRRGDGSPSASSSSRPSEQRLLRSLLPPTQNSLEFGMAMRYPVAYPTLFPLSLDDMSLGFLLKPMTLPHVQQRLADEPLTTQEDEGDSSNAQDTPMNSEDSAVVPSALFDDRLHQLDIALWTPVPIPNHLAIRIISHYLETDYAILPLFDADLFVRDLVEARLEFCSPLLVNALLSWASIAYAPLDPEATAVSHELYLQAQKVFADQLQLNTLTTVAALQLLAMNAVAHGRDDMSLHFIQESVRLGRIMGLFDADSEERSAKAWLGDFEVWTRAASYTAWGVFNSVSLYSLHYHRYDIDMPPLLPKPRHVLSHAAEENPETIAKRTHHAEVSSASSDMWIVFGVALRTYYGARVGPVSQRASLEFAEQVYGQLLAWASNLPLHLARGEESTFNVVMMHVYFHAAITDLFRPFLDSLLRAERLGSVSSRFATPEAVYAASVNQLKRLLLLCRLRYHTVCFCLLWQTAVVYVANAAIREAEHSGHQLDDPPPTEEWSFYLDLCIAGLEDLYVSFPVFGCIAQGVLSVSLRRTALTTARANRVLEELRQLEKHYAPARQLDQEMKTRWVVDLDLSMTDHEAATGKNLAGQLQQLLSSKESAAGEADSSDLISTGLRA